jgi:phage FluMu protein Com
LLLRDAARVWQTIIAGQQQGAFHDEVIMESLYPEFPYQCPRCQCNDVIVGHGSGPHYASLRCAQCNQFLRWVSESYYKALTENASLRQQVRLVDRPNPAPTDRGTAGEEDTTE